MEQKQEQEISKTKEFIEQHRHTEKGKNSENSWGDVDCTDTIDFGTGKTERELTCSVCGASVPAGTPGVESTAVIVQSPYGVDNKFGV